VAQAVAEAPSLQNAPGSGAAAVRGHLAAGPTTPARRCAPVRIQIACRPDFTGERPSATANTIAQYNRAALTLLRLCGRDLGKDPTQVTPNDLTQWFVAQKGRWAKTTIRLYRRGAELFLQAMEGRGTLSKEQYRRLLSDLRLGPVPAESAKPKTASTKAVIATEEEVEVIRAAAQRDHDEDSRIIELTCEYGPELGLRPGEWRRAKVSAGQKYFFVPNSKHSNGRANGPFRAIVIDKMPASDRQRLAELCSLMENAVKAAGNWRRVNKRLASRLARMCKAQGLRRLCLYSFRGTACARYKDAGLSPAEIAALMGHVVDTTSFRSYPNAREVRGKWRKKITVRPSQFYVKKVRLTYSNRAQKIKPANNITAYQPVATTGPRRHEPNPYTGIDVSVIDHTSEEPTTSNAPRM
jgi:integrase